MSIAAFAMLSDGRFPVGGHAHSAGFEAATNAFDLRDEVALADFLDGRLSTTGVTDAHLVAAVHHRLVEGVIDWAELDDEVSARILSPALREVSRLLGRQWQRAAARVLDPAPTLPSEPHQVVAYGAVAHHLGLSMTAAVTVHLHHLVTSVTTAAVRLHGLDPYTAQRLEVDRLDRCEAIASTAAEMAGTPFADLPAPSGPLTEILAERHAVADGRLFRS